MKSTLRFAKSNCCSYLICGFVLLYLSIMPDDVTAQIFTKLTDPAFTSQSSGAGWVDYNKDGKLDAYLTFFNVDNRLYSNSGDGKFRLIENTGLTPAGTNFSGIAWGDYDNDGYADLYITSMSGGNTLLRNLGNGHFERVVNTATTKDGGSFLSCNWVDYDNDGNLDLFVTASGTGFNPGSGNKNFLYKNNGDGSFTKITDVVIASQSTFSSNAGFADIDNDGDQDLFLTEWGKNNWLFENNGNGTFTGISGTEVNVNKNISISCSWGDYDNDGYLDLFVGNGSTSTTVKQENYLFHNNGNKTFTRITTGDIAEYKGCVWTSAWGDVDNDGDVDLYVGTIYEKEELLYINNGDGTFTTKLDFGTVSTTGITGACFGDYDNDGSIDLLVADVGQFGPFIYHNNGNTNNWLNVECVGKISNRSAIGARVKIKATIFGKTFWQIREIHGVNGFRGSDDLRVSFGLGDAVKVDSLVIIWPSKRINVMEDIPVNQFLNITETVPVGFIKADFRADKLSGYSPLEVKFKDFSISEDERSITSWSWDFNGDGIEDSKEKDPVYTFNIYEGKKYSVSLTVSNGNYSNKITREDFVTVTPMFLQNIAQGKSATASSFRSAIYPAKNAVDGVTSSRWLSAASDTQWIQIELDSVYSIGKMVLRWGTNYAVQYKILGSRDGSDWLELLTVNEGKGKTEEFLINSIRAKFIKIATTKSYNSNGFALYEIELYRPTVTNVEDTEEIPERFILNQNYPNPFNPVTTIKFSIPSGLNAVTKGEASVQLKVFDLLGREVQTLVNQKMQPGSFEVKFNGNKLPSGVYFYRLNVGSFCQTKKMLLLK